MSEISDKATALLDASYKIASLEASLSATQGAKIGPVTITVPGGKPDQAAISDKAAEIIRAQLESDITAQIKAAKDVAIALCDEIKAALKAALKA